MAGSAINFANANTSNISIGAAASINTLAACSAMAWVYRTTTLANGGIFTKGTFVSQNRHPSWALRGNDGATPTLGFDYSTQDGQITGDNTLDVIPANRWSLQMFAFDTNAAPQMWKGGINMPVTEFTYSAAGLPATGTPGDDSAASALVGAVGGLSNAFPGYMAFFAYFSQRLNRGAFELLRKATIRTLNPHELRPLFRPYGCVILMPMNFTFGAKAIDWSGYGNHGQPSSDIAVTWGMQNRRPGRKAGRASLLSATTDPFWLMHV